MNKIIVLGGGKIGAAIVELLGSSGDYDLIVADKDEAILGLLRRGDLALHTLDVEDGGALRTLMAKGDTVISALPYFLNIRVAEAARDCGLHYFDLTEDVETTRRVQEIARGAEQVFMPHTVGGGIRTLEDIRQLLLAGSDKVSINSAAVKDPRFVREAARRFGSQCIVVSIDAKRVAPDRWEVFSHGGRKSTGLEAVAWARRAVELGAGELVLNSIDADGTKAGFDLAITRHVSESVGVPVVASGGAGKLEHMAEVLLAGRADAVLAASIFHFGEYTVGQVKAYLAERGLSVRLV